MAKENYLPNLAFQPYIAPQQEIPVEDFNNLGAALNKRYDENISKWDELDAYVNQVQLSEADKSIKDSILKDTRSIIKSIRENGNWENGKIQIREVAKRLANDQALLIAQQNFKKLQEQKDVENKMRMQGQTLIDFAPDRFNQSTIDPLTGRIKVLDYSGAEKLQDYDARRKSIFEGIQADGYDSQSASPTMDASTGAIYQIGSGSSAKYITAKKVKEIASRNLDNYLATSEGQQELKKYTTVNSMNANPLDLKTARKEILNGLINTGLTRTFSQTGRSSSTSVVYPGSIGSQAISGEEGAPSAQLEGTTIEGNQANPVLSSLASKMKDGSLLLVKNKEGIEKQVPWYQMYLDKDAVSMKLSRDSKERLKTLSGEEVKMIDRIATSLGIKKNGNKYANSDLEKIRKFAEDKSNTGIGLTVRTFTDEEIGKQNNYAANGNYANTDRKFYSLDKKRFLNFDELTSKQKDILKSGKKEGIQFQGVFDVDNPFSDMAKTSKKFSNTKGWISPESIIIDGEKFAVSSSISDRNKKDIQFRELSQKISRAGRTGVPIYIGKGQSKELVVPVGNGLYQLKNDKGDLIHEGQFTKEQLALYSQKYNLEPED